MSLTILLCPLTVLVLITTAQAQNEYCNEEMTVCTCPEDAESCHFYFAVQRLITFTRYLNDTPTGTAGKMYFINDLGELEHIPLPPDKTGCSETNCSQANTADGASYRTFIGINGRLPGPTLIVNQGQIVMVDVVNMLLTEVVTIHWHGFTQINTPWMDGAGIISQCPIESGTSFRYIFLADDAGSFWYHSHTGPQRSEGLFGGLIVKSKTEIYPIQFLDLPDQHTLTLLDWQGEDATSLFWKSFSKLRYFPSPQPNMCPWTVPRSSNDFYNPTSGVDGSGIGTISFWSGLINGKGKHPLIEFKNSRLSVFTVEQGKTYRFRLIGAQDLYAFRFSVDGHQLTVIATDANLIEPVVTDYIILHSGERYDFILTANQTGQTDFWMRTETLEADVDFLNELPPYPFLTDHTGLAVLHYAGPPEPVGPEYANILNIPKVCTSDNPCITVNCPFEKYLPVYNITCVTVPELRLLNPLRASELPSAIPDHEFFLNFGFETDRQTSTINGRSFIPYKQSPQIQPVVDALLCMPEDTCFPNGCFCTHQIDLPYNETIRFIFSTAGLSMNRRRFTHPIHFHGHDFSVVKIGYGMYNDTTGEAKTPTTDLMCQNGSTDDFCINPTWTNNTSPTFPIDAYTVRKDTIILPALGYVVVHFRSNNPGWWFLHCHIEPHTLEGMAVAINEAKGRQPPHPPGMQLCGNFTWNLGEFKQAIMFDSDDSDSLSDGAIAGIVIAAIVAVAIAIAIIIIIVIICCCCCKDRSNKINTTSSTTASSSKHETEATTAI